MALQAGLNAAIRADAVPVGDPVWAEKLDRLRPHAAFFDPQPADPAAGRPLRVMALGSSRTQLGFDAGRFTAAAGPGVEAFNFGCPAGGPLTADLYLRRLLAAGAHVDRLFVEVHPCFLTPGDPPFEARWLHAYRLRPDEVPTLRRLGWDLQPPPHHGWRGWLTASHAYRFALLNRYSPVMLPCPFGLTVGTRSDARGYVPGIEVKPHERPRALERTFEQYADAFAGYRVGGPGCAALRDTLAVCRDYGIRPAVVLMPESTEFRGWYGPGAEAEILGFAHKLAGEFDAPVFDGRGWVPDEAAADGHHLSPAGAVTFTERLVRESAGWIGKE